MEKNRRIVRVEPERLENAEQMLREAAPDVLRSVPHNKREQLRLIKFTTTIAKSYSGPLPSPEDMARFSEIIPNGSDRIMAMAENQATHRIDIESHVIRSQQSQSARGQNFALVIGMTGLILGFIAIICGHDTAGATLGGVTLVGLVTAFITGKSSQKKDLERKKIPD